MAILSLPIYVRNIALSGSPIPMPRTHTGITLRERAPIDYLWFDPGVFRRPSIYHVEGKRPSRSNRNMAMANVWGLAYAGWWYDPYAHRIPRAFHRDGVYAGTLTTVLGIVPTAMVLLGFGVGLRELWRRRSATPDAPILAMAALGLASFVSIPLQSASTSIAKGAYLLPPVGAGVWIRSLDHDGQDLADGVRLRFAQRVMDRFTVGIAESRGHAIPALSHKRA